jgi:hypothetical protein
MTVPLGRAHGNRPRPGKFGHLVAWVACQSRNGVRSRVRSRDRNHIGARNKNMTGTYRDVNLFRGCYRVIPFDSNGRGVRPAEPPPRGLISHRRSLIPRAIRMEPLGPVCLRCVGLDDLEFLSAGDALLTRRVKAKSARYAVVVRFSRARRRYERQGVSWSSSRPWRTCNATCRRSEARNARRRTERRSNIRPTSGPAQAVHDLGSPPADRRAPLGTRDRPRRGR